MSVDKREEFRHPSAVPPLGAVSLANFDLLVLAQEMALTVSNTKTVVAHAHKFSLPTKIDVNIKVIEETKKKKKIVGVDEHSGSPSERVPT